MIKKIYGEYFKHCYFKTSGPVLTKLGIKHSCVEEIHIFFSNNEPCPSTRICEMILKTCQNLPQVSDVTHGPLVQMKGHALLKVEIIAK